MKSVKCACVFTMAITASAVFALDIDASLHEAATTDASTVHTENLSAELAEKGNVFSWIGGLSVNTEHQYGVSFQENFFGPFSIDVTQAGMGLSLGELTACAGIFKHYDIVSSPYSLFISGRGLSAPIMEVAYEGKTFSYRDRWIGLTVNSSYGWPERGAVQKDFSLKLGALRLGFQDIAVFTNAYTSESDRYFDISYFITPVPSFFVQYIAAAAGRPWSENINDNSIMGFYGDYTADTWYTYAQLLVDDLYMNWLFNPSAEANPSKVAWSIGGTWDSPIGKLGLYHAGATAYTFESFGSAGYNPMYGYSYYPADAFASGSETLPIDIEDNMVGYQHGENNIAFMATWEKEIEKLACNASLEFTLSGTKSPGNPWHEYVYWPEGGEGTKLLNDAVLEKKIVLSGKATYPWKDLHFSLDFTLGEAFNALELQAVESADSSNTDPIFVPSKDNKFIGSIGLSVGWGKSF